MNIKVFLAVTLTFFLLSVSTLACVCVRDKIKAKGFSGQVFSVLESKPGYKEPLPKATVKLLKRRGDREIVVAEVIAGETGRFSLENVKAGKYILAAEAPNYPRIATKIKIVRSLSGKKDEIVIGLDPKVMGCCEGYLKVQKST